LGKVYVKIVDTVWVFQRLFVDFIILHIYYNFLLTISGIFVTNNDILRRLRFSFEFNDKKVISLFDLAGSQVTEEQIRSWLKKEGEEDYVNLPDSQLAYFLNGLIIDKRGKKDGPTPAIEKRLNNNMILTKLKIALSLQSDDIINLLNSVDFKMNGSELSAFSRKPDHKNYRECKDQVLRNLLQAIQNKFRVSALPKSKTVAPTSPVVHKPRERDIDTQESSDNKTARKGISKAYVNPKATVQEKQAPTRKVLKLKAKDIWKDA
jgi:uncharacterized protein YehS (DUF1456 family)